MGAAGSKAEAESMTYLKAEREEAELQSKVELSADDLFEFKATLKDLRKFDDRIQYKLNAAIPTHSPTSEERAKAEANCKHIYDLLNTAHQGRMRAIDDCLLKVRAHIDQLEASAASDANLQSSLRDEQYAYSTMEAEKNIDQVVQQRSRKLFNERCRPFFKAPR
eukprot:Clim_evm5s24 gene=Clim_evmTU5s24